MGMDRNNSIGGEHVTGLISAYIDHAVDAADQERVRAHLASCEVCQAEHRELQATRQMLRAMPVQAPPRVFTLTEEMVGGRTMQEARPSLLSRLLGRAMAPRLATGSVLAFALLLMILVTDLGVMNQMAGYTTSRNTESPAAPLAGLTQEDTQVTEASKAAPTPEMAMAAAEPTATTGAAEGAADAQDTAVADAANSAEATPVPGGAGGGRGDPFQPPPTPMPAEPGTNPQAGPTATTGQEMEEAPPPVAPTVAPTGDEAANALPFAAPTTEEMALRNSVSETAQAATNADGTFYQTTPSDQGSGGPPVTLLLQLGLALLGTGLAVAAMVARRRSA